MAKKKDTKKAKAKPAKKRTPKISDAEKVKKKPAPKAKKAKTKKEVASKKKAKTKVHAARSKTEGFDACVLDSMAGIKLFGVEDVQRISSEVIAVIEQAEVQGTPVERVVEEMLEGYSRKIQNSKLQRAINLKKLDENIELLNQKGKDGKSVFASTKQAIESLFYTNHKMDYKGKGNLTRKKAQIEDDHFSMILQTANKHDGGMDRLMSKELDVAIIKGLRGELDGLDKFTLEMVTAFKKLNDMSFELKTQAGFGTRYLKDFIAPQDWKFRDMKALHENSDEAKKLWTVGFDKAVDWERTKTGFYPDGHEHAGKPRSKEDYMSDFWDKKAINDGKSLTQISKEADEIASDAVSQTMASARRVHFKSAQSLYDYNELLGGRPLMDRVMSGVRKDSAKIAAAQMFGPNFKAGFKMMLDSEASNISRGERANLEKMFDFVVNGARQPEMNLWARFGDIARKLVDMTKLATALPTTLTDFAYSAGIISAHSGKNFVQVQAEVFGNFFKTVSNSKFQKEIAAKMHVYLQDVHNLSINNRFGDMEAGGGNSWFDKLHQTFMRGTGLPLQARAMRLADVKMMSNYLADIAGTDFDKLYKGMQDGLKKFGINETNWKYIRKAMDDFSDGTKGVTVEKINDLPDEVFAGLTKSEIRQAKVDLRTGIAGFLSEVAETGSPTPGIKQQMWKETLDRNSAMGQMARFMGQYKSFALSQFKTMNSIYNTGASGKYSSVGLNGNVGLLAGTAVTASGFGAMALMAKDVMKGYDPMDRLKDPSAFALDAFVQSGAGLLTSDFILAEWNKSFMNVGAQIAGPFWGGPANDVATMMAKLIHGDLLGEGKGLSANEAISKTMRSFVPQIHFTGALVNKNIAEAMYRYLNNGKPPKGNKNKNNRYSWYQDE